MVNKKKIIKIPKFKKCIRKLEATESYLRCFNGGIFFYSSLYLKGGIPFAIGVKSFFQPLKESEITLNGDM